MVQSSDYALSNALKNFMEVTVFQSGVKNIPNFFADDASLPPGLK